MEEADTLADAIELLLERCSAQESLLFLLSHYMIEAGAVSAPALAEHLRGYTGPCDTPGITKFRHFYADVIGGTGSAI